ncbi:ImmA/IrrE family metallo-endopeptidase [Candidatus Poribacteria bacterium]|nr:ImmA/IrrE family metallo-endopeptidase [Candidatus Poribacteria bacterium]
MRQLPTYYARDLLSGLSISDIPVYPRKIAEKMGISVWEREADSGYDGYLISVEGNWGIMVNSSIKSKARIRFTIAHELGHYTIDYHNSLGYQCFGKDIGSLGEYIKKEEREANEFAVELLMPENVFRQDIQNRDISLKTISFLARKYKTSITSTAIRYARFNPEVCAIIVSEEGKIRYFSYSESFRKDKSLYLSRSAPLQEGTFAKKLFDKDIKDLDAHGEVYINSWSKSASDSKAKMIEQSRYFPKFKQILSLIWLENKGNNSSKPIAHILVK